MRIDVFFDAFPHPAKPNMEAQLLEWQRQGQRLRIFSFGRIGNATSAFPVTFLESIRSHPVRMIGKMVSRALHEPSRTWRIIRTAPGVRAALKRLERDAQLPADPPEVHFMHNLAAAVPLSYLKAACPNTTHAIYYHGGELPGVPQIPAPQAATALGCADIVFSNTRASIEEVVARGAQRERTACAPTAFRIDRFQLPTDRRYLPEGRWRFVCVGRMSPEKGFDSALKAFAALRQRNVPLALTLIGDGGMRCRLEALADRLQLGDSVHFLGHLDIEALIPRLADFDALVLSSVPVAGSNWRETQGTVMQEAMLMGTVVVASDLGGVRESVPAGLHAYLYPPGSVDGLVDRLAALMRLDEAALRDLSHAARSFVVENYDIRIVNQRLLDRLAACRGIDPTPATARNSSRVLSR
jgi:glycosyltransferase involved in cell wall biosynthesis